MRERDAPAELRPDLAKARARVRVLKAELAALAQPGQDDQLRALNVEMAKPI